MTRPVEVDLVVVGAGPAGAAAALAARRIHPGARVVLLDRSDFPRDKPCGDGIAGHAVAALAGLGAGDVVDGYTPVAELELHGPGGAAVRRRLPVPVWTIPRTVFDARIVAVAESAGVERHVHRVRELTPLGDRVDVDGRWRARGVIGADGASSRIRRLIGRPATPRRHRAVAARGYVDLPGAPDDGVQQIAFVPGPPWPAYRWRFPIGDGTANVGFGAYVGDGTAGTTLTDRIAEAFPGARNVRAHVLPLSPGRPVPGRGRVLLAGDAAGLVNPLSGEGIYYAVASGRAAATALLGSGRPLTAYRSALARTFGAHFATTRLVRVALDSPAFVDAAVAAAGRRPVRFAEAVELTLGSGTISPGGLADLVGELVRRAGRRSWAPDVR